MSDLEQAVSEIEQTATPEGTTESAPFYTYSGEDGEQVFNTPEELSKYIHDGTLRHADYTRKRQEDSKKSKEVEALRSELEKERKAIGEMRSKYDPIDEYLRTPQGQKVYQELQNRYRGVTHDDVLDQSKYVVDERLNEFSSGIKKELEELKQWKQQQELDREKRAAVDALKAEFDDFDEDAVQKYVELLDSKSSLSSEEQTKEFYRLIHKALKADAGMAQLERKASQKVKPPPISSKGGKKGQEVDLDGLSERELLKLATEELGG